MRYLDLDTINSDDEFDAYRDAHYAQLEQNMRDQLAQLAVFARY